MTWFHREQHKIHLDGEKRVRTEGLWVKCDGCKQVVFKTEIDGNLHVCPSAAPLQDGRARSGSQICSIPVMNWWIWICAPPIRWNSKTPAVTNPRLQQAQEKTGLNDAIINALGRSGPA